MTQTAANTPPTLRADRITVGYPGAAPILTEQSLQLIPGQVTALIGPNGSGKSTLLKAIGRHLTPTQGVILLDGHDLAQRSPRDLARRLGVLFQDNGAPSGVTVEDLVRHGRHPHRGFFEDLTDEDHAAVERALRLTGTLPLRHRPINKLSGGQRQLAWFALVLAQAPQLLLLDEPTTFLDLRHQLEIMEIIATLRAEGTTTIAMVLHDINQAARYADTLVALRDGRIIAQGDPRTLVTPKLLRDVFQIEAELLTTADGLPICVPLGPARDDTAK